VAAQLPHPRQVFRVKWRLLRFPAVAAVRRPLGRGCLAESRPL